MDNETNAGLIAAVAERDRRIAELTQALLDAADALDRMDESDPSTTTLNRASHARVKATLSGGTAALDAAVASAVLAERQRVRAAVESLNMVIVKVPDTTGIRGREQTVWPVEMWSCDDVLAAIGGAS